MAHRILFIATCIFLSFPSTGEPASLPIAVEPIQILGLEAEPARQREALRVIERFDDVGLELPNIVVEFHDTTTPCNGHDGFIRYVEPVATVSICSDRPYVLPHELAHAWVDAHVTDEAKADYVARWGLSSWNDKSDDWDDRGTEHAAFVIQQNLTAAPMRLTNTWLERADAFEEITGLASPLR